MKERTRSIDAVAIVIAKVLVTCAALHFGFTHVSDDDYARTVISQRFAIAPSFDPSATSWLPFPFWLTGSSMMVFGRTLDVALKGAMLVSALGCGAAYLALRLANVERAPALVTTLLAMALPWSAWLGAASVPEGFVPQLLLIGMLAANAPTLRGRAFGAVALTMAALSRYEAWPVCAVFFLAGCTPPISPKRLAVHALPLAGPASWMMWNLHAHGSATHFLARVAAYRDAIGATGNGALTYPKAIVAIGMEPFLLGLFGLVVVCIRRDLRQRWAAPLFACITMLAFLTYGESRGGAPTHHPERAVSAIAWVLIGVGVDGLFTIAVRQAQLLGRVAGVLLAIWAFLVVPTYGDAPGKSVDEDRGPQLARGSDFRMRDVRHVALTPCAYEHFALIAAFGFPERVDITPIAPKDAAAHAPTSSCPATREN